MKNLIIFSLILLVSCTQKKNKYQDCIEKYLQDIAMGVKLENDFKEIALVKEITSKELLIDMYHTLELDTIIPVDTVLFMLDRRLKTQNISNFDVWQFRRNRFYKVSQLKNNEIAYSLVHATHEFNNPLLNNALVEVKRTYIIDKDCNVLGSIDDKDMAEYEKKYPKTPYSKYEYSIMERQ